MLLQRIQKRTDKVFFLEAQTWAVLPESQAVAAVPRVAAEVPGGEVPCLTSQSGDGNKITART